MMSPPPLYGWYGDDLTGATDTLATISRTGGRAFLFLAPPTNARLASVGPLDAIGIAGAARAMSPADMRENLPSIASFFREVGVRLVHYKCCSTFDSAPEIGNLAVATAIFRQCVSSPVVAIVGGQPSLGRYCVFSNLFAAARDQVFRIDRHPTMSRHPATPMNEADLVRHLSAQGLDGIQPIHLPVMTRDNFATAWQARADATAILLDVAEQGQLALIGDQLRAIASQKSLLVLGASSVAEAWFGHSPTPEQGNVVRAEGPVLALVGSLSPVTREQLKAAQSYERVDIAPSDMIPFSSRQDELVAQACQSLAAGRNVMVSTAPVDDAGSQQSLPGLAQASAALIDAILTRHPVQRLAIAGGDTSSIVTTALGFWGLSYHGLAARGVALCRGRHADPQRDGMVLMLKGGQMGPPELFENFAGVNR